MISSSLPRTGGRRDAPSVASNSSPPVQSAAAAGRERPAAHHQKSNLTPSCTWRAGASPAPVMVPKLVAERLLFGAPKLVRFSTLNASTRNSEAAAADQREGLVQPEVEHVERRTARRRCARALPNGCADVGRHHHVRRVEPLRDALLALRPRRCRPSCSDDTSAPRSRSEGRRRRVGQVDRQAARHRVDRRQPPAAERCPRPPPCMSPPQRRSRPNGTSQTTVVTLLSGWL